MYVYVRSLPEARVLISLIKPTEAANLNASALCKAEPKEKNGPKSTGELW